MAWSSQAVPRTSGSAADPPIRLTVKLYLRTGDAPAEEQQSPFKAKKVSAGLVASLGRTATGDCSSCVGCGCLHQA